MRTLPAVAAVMIASLLIVPTVSLAAQANVVQAGLAAQAPVAGR